MYQQLREKAPAAQPPDRSDLSRGGSEEIEVKRGNSCNPQEDNVAV